MMKIYLARNNVQAGPYTLDELNRMLSSGEVLMSDLMWHTGMSNWQSVGQMTDNQTHYHPTGNNAPPTPATHNSAPNRGFGDNVDFNPPNAPNPSNEQTSNTANSDSNHRVSVAELYGRTPSTPVEQHEPKPIHTPPAYTRPIDDGKIIYASSGARFLAFLINIGLFIVALLPMFIAFASVADMAEFTKISQTQDYATIQAYSQSLVAKIPSTTVAVSNLMLFSLLGIQLLLIFMRGQSFGKLVMGIRVVDKTTYKLARLSTLAMRTLVLITLYLFGMLIMSGLPAIIMLTINYIMASRDERHQGWHDKMVGTCIIKARPNQLDKTAK